MGIRAFWEKGSTSETNFKEKINEKEDRTSLEMKAYDISIDNDTESCDDVLEYESKLDIPREEIEELSE